METLAQMHDTQPHRLRARAEFAVVSRLVSCLVTEQILRAFYVAFEDEVDGATGFMAVIPAEILSNDTDTPRTLHSKDIILVMALRNPPVFKDHDGQLRPHGQIVGLVDPLDMLPETFHFSGQGKQEDTRLVQSIRRHLDLPLWDLAANDNLQRLSDPIQLWRKLKQAISVADDLYEVISNELQSSLDWQTLAYQNPPSCPSLDSAPIEWEQSLVAGHPTHPMHRARMLPKNYPIQNPMDYDWYHPRIRFIRLPRSSLDVHENFDRLSAQFVEKAFEQAGRTMPPDDPGLVYLPVHELQIGNIKSRISYVDVLPDDIYLDALAQSSIRTVVVPTFPGIALKLAVGVKISSSLRTISHFTADFGPRFSKEVLSKLAIDPEILTVETEPSSAVYRSADPEVAKHCTALVRQQYVPPDGETLIVCAALLESGHAGLPEGKSVVEHVFELDTEAKREAFLDRYIEVACRALIPALVENGVAFEAHAQNVLARFDSTTKELKGFVFRDLGGLRIHPPTLRKSTGVDFQFLPKHCVATTTLEEIFPKFYHTFVHNHIQRLIRLLGLHHNGRGWEMLRTHMNSVIPKEHPVWGVWLDPASTSVDSKCLMRMRMRDSYRDMVYSPYPNMIQYRPQAQPNPQASCQTQPSSGGMWSYLNPLTWASSKISSFFISMYSS